MSDHGARQRFAAGRSRIAAVFVLSALAAIVDVLLGLSLAFVAPLVIRSGRDFRGTAG
jgi:hypothetical protein